MVYILLSYVSKSTTIIGAVSVSANPNVVQSKSKIQIIYKPSTIYKNDCIKISVPSEVSNNNTNECKLYKCKQESCISKTIVSTVTNSSKC
jgi:hypothetical protein